MKTNHPIVPGHNLAEMILAHLQRLAAGRTHYGLLDHPWHENIGDSAIWLGEVELLGKLYGRPASYVSTVHCRVSEPGQFLSQDHLIYLHGGGNFGDIWPRFQSYREAILQRYPDHRIVQLPQSLHYRNAEGIEQTKRVIGGHRDFHLMVRDRESFDLAQQEFDCEVVLAPDSAFGIDMAEFPRHTTPRGLKALLRDDRERRDDALAGRAFFKEWAIEDWNKVSDLRRGTNKIILGGLVLASVSAIMPLRQRQFYAMARERVEMGFAQLDTAEVIVTDRLHGHIMATLLGKPHVVVDNSYGKIRRFIDAWGRNDTTLVAQDYAQAREMADQLLGGNSPRLR